MTKHLAFLDKHTPTAAGELLIDWWRGLVDDRGGRAGLRRAQGFDDVILVGAFQRLRRTLLAEDWVFSPETLADVALAVAEIDAGGDSPGKSFATDTGEHKALTPTRLKLLADTDDPAMFLRLLRCALVQAKREASVLHTAELVRRWRRPASRIRARRRLVLDYFEAAKDELLNKV